MMYMLLCAVDDVDPVTVGGALSYVCDCSGKSFGYECTPAVCDALCTPVTRDALCMHCRRCRRGECQWCSVVHV